MNEVVRLWADGAPDPIEGLPPETEWIQKTGVAAGSLMVRNVSDATLTVFTPDAAVHNGHGVIVAPGGGWTIHAWTHEGTDVAAWLNSLGYTVFLLKYRVMASEVDQDAFDKRWAAADSSKIDFKTADKPEAIGKVLTAPAYLAARAAAATDGRRAIEVVRAEAERFGVRHDTLGMLGFSAGAFMMVDVALDPRAEQVAYIAPIYGGETQGAPVPADAPALFTAVAQDDVLVRIVEGLYRDWAAADRPVEMHVFRRGQHGFGMVKQGLPSDAWTDLFAAWLQDLSG